jgi:hypothetical protein
MKKKEFKLMYEVINKAEYMKFDIYSKVTNAFSKSRPNRTERAKFRKESEDFNRETFIESLKK